MADDVITNDRTQDADLQWTVMNKLRNAPTVDPIAGLQELLKESVQQRVYHDLKRLGVNDTTLRSFVISLNDDRPFDATIRLRGHKDQIAMARSYFDKEFVAKNGRAGSFQAEWESPETLGTYLNLHIHSRNYTDTAKALSIAFQAYPRLVWER